jgi:antitoxin (DNA-binding transcriptional repressor) of toxin-antitoxin stability system
MRLVRLGTRPLHKAPGVLRVAWLAWPGYFSCMNVNMQDAKTNLSQLVAAAERGETVILCRDGKPVVELRPLNRRVARTKIDSSDLGSPVSREEALTPLSPGDWADWAGG